MSDNNVLKLVYTFFLGILLAVFVGVGVNTFYPGPKEPEYPIILNTGGKELTTEQIAIQQQYDTKMAQHNKDMKPYNRNVSMITLGAAVVFLVISLLFEKHMKFISDGVLLGGLFTLVYSIGRGFASSDTKYIFATVTIGLIIVLYLGYSRFVAPRSQLTKV